MTCCRLVRLGNLVRCPEILRTTLLLSDSIYLTQYPVPLSKPRHWIQFWDHKSLHKQLCLSLHTVSASPSPSSSSSSYSAEDEDDTVIPDPPTNCCMSGCANCVWLDYAEELARLYSDGGRAAEKVLKAIEDPSLRIFMSIELREKLKADNKGEEY